MIEIDALPNAPFSRKVGDVQIVNATPPHVGEVVRDQGVVEGGIKVFVNYFGYTACLSSLRRTIHRSEISIFIIGRWWAAIIVRT